MEFYEPNYKVILTVRDNPEQWYKSVDRTLRKIHALMGTYSMRFLTWSKGQNTIKRNNVTCDHLVFDVPLGQHTDYWSNQQKLMQKYEDWIEGVKRHVPKDKLLVSNVKEGWDPLCNFLGVEAPDEPFPRSNETAKLQKEIKMFERVILAFNCTVGVLAFAGIAAGYLMFRNKR